MLFLVPFMPTLPSAMGLLPARFAISQREVPTRQSHTMAMGDSHERAAAAGVTEIARSLGAAAAPVVGAAFLLTPSGTPFLITGAVKVAYDLLVYRSFRRGPLDEGIETT